MLSNKKNTNEQAGDKKSIFLFLVLLIAIAGVAATVYMKSQNIKLQDISPSKIFNVGYLKNKEGSEVSVVSKIKYESKENPVFCSYKGSIIQYSNKYLKAINQKGKDEWQLELPMQAPMLKSTEGYLMAADTKGKNICVISGNSVKWEASVEGSIINADINPHGYVAVVHSTKNYKSAVSVYDTTGQKIFTSYMGDKYVLAAKVFPSDKQVIVNSIDTSGVKAISGIEFLDMLGNSLNATYTLSDNIYPQIWCFNNGTAISVNDSAIVCSDKNKSGIWKAEFDKKSIYASILCENKYLVIASASASKNSENSSETAGIHIYSTSGKLLNSYKLDNAASSMAVFNDKIAVNVASEAHFINSKGRLEGIYLSKNEIIQLEMLSENEAAVITKGDITVVKI